MHRALPRDPRNQVRVKKKARKRRKQGPKKGETDESKAKTKERKSKWQREKGWHVKTVNTSTFRTLDGAPVHDIPDHLSSYWRLV